MRSIREIAKDLASGEVQLGPEKVRARALRASESDLMAEVWPRPVPDKLRPAPGKGSLELIPDERDPGHLLKLAAWVRLTQCVEVAAACGLAYEGRPWDPARPRGELAAWGDGVTREMCECLTVSQITAAFIAVRDLVDHRRARAEVLVEVPAEDAKRADPAEYRLPEHYALGDGGVFLRTCERFGRDPFSAAGVAPDDPGMWALVLAYEGVRTREESEQLKALAGLLAR